jgi:hypothetical protein
MIASKATACAASVKVLLDDARKRRRSRVHVSAPHHVFNQWNSSLIWVDRSQATIAKSSAVFRHRDFEFAMPINAAVSSLCA